MPSSSGRWSGRGAGRPWSGAARRPPPRGRCPSAWRPMVSSATTGPRVNRAPPWIALRHPKPSTTAHSQGVEQKSSIPPGARSACRRLAGGLRGGDLTGRGAAREQPRRGVDGERPPRPDGDDEQGPAVGPSTIMPLRVRDTSALAGWSSRAARAGASRWPSPATKIAETARGRRRGRSASRARPGRSGPEGRSAPG